MQSENQISNLYLESDSTYALAYLGLGDAYFNKHKDDSYNSETYLDSVLILADIALSYDNHLAEAYKYKGDYYNVKGKSEQAIKEYDKAFKCNPNYGGASADIAWLVYAMDYSYRDYVKTIEFTGKAVSLERGEYLPFLVRQLATAYEWAGFPEKANEYYVKAFNLDRDSNKYYLELADRELNNKNFKHSIELYQNIRPSTRG